MRILIDIGHPAHVHYFRNFIFSMKQKGHDLFITARDKEVSQILLKKNNIEFISRGKGSNSLIGKLLYIFKADYIIWRNARKFKPDIFLSFASPYAAHVSKLLRKPHITFDDTEHAHLAHKLYAPFSDVILSPACFFSPFSKRQLFFSSYMELCCLHPNYFIPDKTILKQLDVSEDEKYVILRFVSWDANHDIGQLGMSYQKKILNTKELSKLAKVFISSEGEIPEEIRKFQIHISPEKIHDVLFYSSLYLGEGATMASECAMLGTPAIYVNSLNAGTLQEQEKYGLLYGFRNSNGVLEKAIELLNTPNIKQEFQNRRQKMLADKIDVTAFMVWFIENYPESVRTMQENMDYQYNFK